MICYLAYPIDLCRSDAPHHVELDALRESLRLNGLAVYEPARAWSLSIDRISSDDQDKLSEVNFSALDQADLVVALAPIGVPSVGVPIEVYHTLAINDGKVALWFSNTRPIGAMWHHLCRAYESRVRMLPREMDATTINNMVEWASEDVE